MALLNTSAYRSLKPMIDKLTSSPRLVPLLCTADARRHAAEHMAERFALTMVLQRPTAGHWLELGKEHLALYTKGQQGPVYAEFVEGAATYRRKQGGGRKQALAKAIGLKNTRASPYVVDATAGLGRDAFVLACLGCRVTLLERSPIAAALLADGLERALAHIDTNHIVDRMHLIHTNAIEWLPALDATQRPDVVLLDPMFPDRARSSAVKKNMATFQQVIGDDHDTAALLAAAITAATTRVVVKRPRLGAAIDGVHASAQIIGKSTRFDLYLVKAIQPR